MDPRLGSWHKQRGYNASFALLSPSHLPFVLEAKMPFALMGPFPHNAQKQVQKLQPTSTFKGKQVNSFHNPDWNGAGHTFLFKSNYEMA